MSASLRITSVKKMGENALDVHLQKNELKNGFL